MLKVIEEDEMNARVSKAAAVIALLASLGLGLEDRRKLEARLSFIGRSGFPEGVNAGRGFRGGYTFEQFWQIFMLLHLQRLGLPLGAAIKLVQTHWVVASAPIDLAFEDSSDDLQMTFFWVFKPTEALPGDESVTKGSFSTLGLLPGQALQEEVSGGAHFAAIDASAVIRKATSALATDDVAKAELIAAHQLWREEVNSQLHKHLKSKADA
jgi:hypothetical protein